MPVPSSWARGRRCRSATTWRGATTSFRRRPPHASPRASARRTSSVPVRSSPATATRCRRPAGTSPPSPRPRGSPITPGRWRRVSMSDFELRERLTSRPDLADLTAYGAPQLDVDVRLNTNESPYPPPTAFREDLAGRVAKLGLNRYPDRDFTELREGLARHAGTLTERLWAANGSNEIIQQLLPGLGGL